VSGRLLTAAEVGAMLGVQPATVCRWIEAGRLPAFRLGAKGGRLRIREADVLTMLEAGATMPERVA
jgi:excisionase family DNA binding protein